MIYWRATCSAGIKSSQSIVWSECTDMGYELKHAECCYKTGLDQDFWSGSRCCRKNIISAKQGVTIRRTALPAYDHHSISRLRQLSSDWRGVVRVDLRNEFLLHLKQCILFELSVIFIMLRRWLKVTSHPSLSRHHKILLAGNNFQILCSTFHWHLLPFLYSPAPT